MKQRYDNKHELGRLIDISNKQKLQIEELKKENDKLVRILSEAEDFIEIRLPEYYIQQYNAPDAQFILYAPQNNPHTTIMYANIMDGYVNLIKYVAKKCGMEYYNVSIYDGTSQMMEAYHFHYYSSTKCRHILCYQDPQWVFYEDGEPLEFENVELYKLRLKKKRLNKEIILQYLNHLGWNLLDENFWRTENVVYEFVQTTPHI